MIHEGEEKCIRFKLDDIIEINESLNDSVERPEDGAEVGGASLPDAVDEDALLVEAVRHREAEILVDVVLEERHAVHLEGDGQ